jgi:hypothetical protein
MKKKLLTSATDFSRIPHVLKLAISVLIFAFLLPTTVSAHRVGIDVVDDCRIRIGNESVHFTAYTPTLTPGKEYCKTIPQLGPTNLVFDYEGKELRDLSIEFEITKEPEGTRIFYQEPNTHSTGNVNGVIDFSQYGAGDYMVHVTMVNNGEKIDNHIPFQVGFEETSYTGIAKIAFFLLMLVLIVFLIIKAKANDKKSALPPSGE